MKIKLLLSVFVFIFLISGCEKNVHKKSKPLNDQELSSVPAWSTQAIWYQIFVERFRNGDPSNDPTRFDIVGTYPDSIPGNWKITPWGQDWYKPDEYFSQSPLPNKWDNLQLRRYGGDLQGVLDELDYIQSLGINAIYFNPLNDSPSLHKYDPRYWRHIDRNFGPNPKKDIEIISKENNVDPETWQWTTADSLFLAIVKECHNRGIKVILDYSWNHTGKEFWAFKDIKEKGKESEFADWFEIEEFDNPTTPENEFRYNGWAGVQTMPEIKKDIIGTREDVPLKGNLHNIEAKQHILNVTKRWLDPDNDGDPSDGIDGYRLDVAEKVPIGFWQEYRKFVKSINPEAVLIGEIWWKSWPDELMLPQKYLQGDVFDAVMHYHWYRPTRQFFADAPEAIKPSEYVAMLNEKLEGIDPERQKAMMNLTSSHDSPRTSTSIYNNGKYKYMAKPWENPNYKIEKPDKKTRKIQEMILVHQYTFIGSPHIWYGDEVGMWGADDPCTRKPMVWSDLVYEDETTHPLNQKRNTDKVEQDTALLNFYKQLIKIRKENPVLVYGDLEFVLVDDTNQVLAYSRFDNDNEVIVVFNKSENNKKIEIPVKFSSEYSNILNNTNKYLSNNGSVFLEVESLKAIILIRN